MTTGEIFVAAAFAILVILAVRRIIRKGACDGCSACKGGSGCTCHKKAARR